LALVEPGLARRVAAFRSYQVSILFEHLKKRDEKRPAFTAAECEAVARVCGPVVLAPRFVGAFRDALVAYFRMAWPELADKLARLSEQEVARLCERVRQRRERPAPPSTCCPLTDEDVSGVEWAILLAGGSFSPYAGELSGAAS
jgi:hypothetical protein